MVLPAILRPRRNGSGETRASWAQRWAAFLMDRRETATRPMTFDWLSI